MHTILYAYIPIFTLSLTLLSLAKFTKGCHALHTEYTETLSFVVSLGYDVHTL